MKLKITENTMTPKERAEMERLKKRNQLLETHRRNLPKGPLDRLIWLVHEIEAKPKVDRFIKVPLSASDGRLLRQLVERLVEP